MLSKEYRITFPSNITLSSVIVRSVSDAAIPSDLSLGLLAGYQYSGTGG